MAKVLAVDFRRSAADFPAFGLRDEGLDREPDPAEHERSKRGRRGRSRVDLATLIVGAQ